jgi:ADP-ribosylglycohydrolase
MALCILESVLEKGWDIEDQGARFLRWLTEGHLTAHGGVFDIGGTTRESLLRIRDGFRADEAGCFEENSNGNGSLMRNLPAALYLASRGDAGLAEGVSASSAITHAHSRSRLGCIIHALVSSELLAGRDAASALRGAASRLEALRRAGHLGSGMEGEISAYDRALSEGLGDLPRDKVSSSGYVVDTLEAALWCLLRSSSFEECVLSAVNLGRDTDTVGAVAGGLAGLLWGKEAIPGVWLETLVRKELILTMAEGLAGAGEEGTK